MLKGHVIEEENVTGTKRHLLLVYDTFVHENFL